MHYALKNKNFAFVNHPPLKNRNLRITLKDTFKGEETLNIIAEYHYVGPNQYEVTVVTALRKDDFWWSQGDFAVEFEGTTSRLLINDKKVEREVDSHTP